MSNKFLSASKKSPQFVLGATSSDAEMAQQIADSPLEGQGAIVARLGQQFQIPRASTDSQMGSRSKGGMNVGES